MKIMETINNCAKMRELKNKYEAILDSFTGGETDELYNNIHTLFKSYGLEEFQFKIETKRSNVDIIPLRPIDRYIIIALWAC